MSDGEVNWFFVFFVKVVVNLNLFEDFQEQLSAEEFEEDFDREEEYSCESSFEEDEKEAPSQNEGKIKEKLKIK